MPDPTSERTGTPDRITVGTAGIAVLSADRDPSDPATDGGEEMAPTEVEATTLTEPSNYKVRGRIDDDTGAGVYGTNTATEGGGEGVVGTTDAPGVEDDINLVYDTAAGVRGEANDTTGVRTAGVFGRDGNANDGAKGVKGVADNSEGGATYGVYGETLGGPSAAGVYGRNAVDADNYGVLGETDATDGHGVLGRATAADAEFADGVQGETTGGNGAGVRGVNTSSSGSAHGVVGDTEGGELSAGVLGESPDGDHANVSGVNGINTSTGQDSAGVRGINWATGGPSHGVYGETGSVGAGVFGRTTSSDGTAVYSDGDATIEGNASVTGNATVAGDASVTGKTATGTLEVEKVGGLAKHDPNNTTDVASDGSETPVPLVATEFDHFNWHTTSTRSGFEISEAGTYHVDVGFHWSNLGGGQDYIIYLNKGTSSDNRITVHTSNGTESTSLSRMFEHDGTSTETVHLSVRLYGSIDRSIWPRGTFLSMRKLG